ncbi:MAG: hypothetical protein K0R02_1191, partial [Rickettsiaceae bacterium]|nr:hypothetical protein [Rickettsiaceae bacterium]
YEVIGNATDANDKFIDNTGEAAYLFNKAYHRGGEKGLKYVGYECSGALFLEYGERLYKGKEFVNQIFNKDKEKFEGGTVFAKIQATSRTDNPGSEHILRNLGCKEIEINQKFGHERFLFEKDLSLDDSSVIPDGISTEMLGLNIDSSSD